MWEGPAKTCLHVGRAGGPVSVLRHTLAGDHRSARSWLASTRWLAVQLCSNREWACARTPEPPTQRRAVSLPKISLRALSHSWRVVIAGLTRNPCGRAKMDAPGSGPGQASQVRHNSSLACTPGMTIRWHARSFVKAGGAYLWAQAHSR